MKNRRQARFVSLLLLCSLLAGMVVSVQADEVVETHVLLSKMKQLTPINKTNYLLAQEWDGIDWGVYSTDGELLIPCKYASLSYLSYHCFLAEMSAAAGKTKSSPPTLEDVNSYALVTDDGTQVTTFRYGTFKVFNPYWACGWILEDGAEDDYDYKANGMFYRIKRCDVFYMGSHAAADQSEPENARQVAALTRDEYKNAAAHGKYLYVQNRQDEITVYEGPLRLEDFQPKNLSESIYFIKNWAVWNRASNEMIMDGFSAVEEITTNDGVLLKATRLDYSGNQWVGLFTTSGEELMPLTLGAISSITPEYVLLTNNGKQGLYSLRERKLVVSCDYDKIITCDTSLDPYVLHGYLCVENDGTRYYIEVKTGKVLPAENAATGRTRKGNTYFSNVRAQSTFYIYAPDNVVSKMTDGYVENASSLRGSGYLFSAKTEARKHVLYTWHGEIAMQFSDYAYVITDDDKVIAISAIEGYKLCEVVTIGE